VLQEPGPRYRELPTLLQPRRQEGSVMVPA
jgi:hypothetical protein